MRLAVDLAAETHLLVVIRRADDAGLSSLQRFRNFLDRIADAGNDAHPGDNNAAQTTVSFLKCFRVVEKPDFQVGSFVDQFAVGVHFAIADAENEFAVDHALQVDDGI
jgi:hypothetical protein